MKFPAKLAELYDAPVAFFAAASTPQKCAPPSTSPKDNSVMERCLGSSAHMTHIIGALGDGAATMENPQSPSHERQSGLVFCEWCGSVTRPIAVHGHEQCGRCHRVLTECCKGEVCDGVAI